MRRSGTVHSRRFSTSSTTKAVRWLRPQVLVSRVADAHFESFARVLLNRRNPALVGEFHERRQATNVDARSTELVEQKRGTCWVPEDGASKRKECQHETSPSVKFIERTTAQPPRWHQ